MLDNEKQYAACVYTDGSANNMLKIWGWGSHGYIYDINEKPKVTKNKPVNIVVTDIGYLEPGELKIKPNELVNPVAYLDWYGSYRRAGTNNVGELLAIIETVKKLLEHNVTKITLFSDSTYAIGVFKSSKTKTKESIIKNVEANQDLWLLAKDINDTIEKSNIELTIEKIKAHNGHLGNHTADDMAMLGRYNSTKIMNDEEIDFTLREPQGYWKPKNERHPFLTAKQIFFTNNDKNLNEYSLLGYKEENEIGKKMHIANFGLVVLKDKDETIDLVKNTYNELLGEHSVVSTVRMDLLFKPDNFKYVERYGKKCLMPLNKNRRGISILEKEIVANSINPPALAYTALNNLDNLRVVLNDFNSLRADKGYITGKEFIDITDMYYTTNDKGKNVFKQELGNDVKSLKYVYEVDGKKADLIIQFGKDILARNPMKKIEKLEPKVYLVIVNSNNVKLDYYTIVDIESTGDQSVWSNFYAKTVFIK